MINMPALKAGMLVFRVHAFPVLSDNFVRQPSEAIVAVCKKLQHFSSIIFLTLNGWYSFSYL